MKDELFDRDFQVARAHFNHGIDRALIRLGQAIVTAFRVLNRQQWSAPWRQRTTCR